MIEAFTLLQIYRGLERAIHCNHESNHPVFSYPKESVKIAFINTIENPNLKFNLNPSVSLTLNIKKRNS